MNFVYREIRSAPAPTNARRSTARGVPASTSTEPRLFAGTAGHCVDGVGARVALCEQTYLEQTVESGSCGSSFGTVAFHVDDESDDFAFIEIDRDKQHLVNPTMRGFDGPTGVISGSDAQPGDGAHVYGNGVGVGETDLTRPRTGWLTRSNARTYAATLPVILGDSGGPVLHESGAAFGIIAHVVASTDLSTLDGNTIEHALRTAAANGFNLEVVPG